MAAPREGQVVKFRNRNRTEYMRLVTDARPSRAYGYPCTATGPALMVSRPMCGRLPVTCPPPRLRSSRGRPMSNDPTDYRREINRDLDPDEYEAVMFKYEGGQKWHAVAG